jgi:hypothetical protein
VDEVVGLVRLEYLMVDDGVRLESVAEIPNRTVHHILMQSPFKERGENHTYRETREAPENKSSHDLGSVQQRTATK